MDATKVSLGLLLLAVSSAILFLTSPAVGGAPVAAAAAAAIGLALGALLVGTSAQEGRPV